MAAELRIRIVRGGLMGDWISLSGDAERVDEAARGVVRGSGNGTCGVAGNGRVDGNDVGASTITMSQPAVDAPARALSIPDALEAYGRYMRTKRKRERSIHIFRMTLEKAAVALEWKTVRDLKLAPVIDYLAGKMSTGAWSGTTHDSAASAFRGFGLFLRITERLPTDPFENLERSNETGEPGSRAVTTDEARAIIRAALLRVRYDRRARGDAPLFWCFLCYTGLRHGEAAKCKWKDVDLENACIITDPAWSKNKKRQPVPIHPRLLALIRERLLPGRAGPNTKLFPKYPNRNTWHSDREGGGVAYKDQRNRGATVHSCRKWLDTTLDKLKTETGVRHRIIRHYGGLDDRYLDHPAESDVLAVAGLPDLWPEDTNKNDGLCIDPVGRDDTVYQSQPRTDSMTAPATTSRPNNGGLSRTSGRAVTSTGCGSADGLPLPGREVESASVRLRFEDESGPAHLRFDLGPVIGPGIGAIHQNSLRVGVGSGRAHNPTSDGSTPSPATSDAATSHSEEVSHVTLTGHAHTTGHDPVMNASGRAGADDHFAAGRVIPRECIRPAPLAGGSGPFNTPSPTGAKETTDGTDEGDQSAGAQRGMATTWRGAGTVSLPDGAEAGAGGRGANQNPVLVRSHPDGTGGGLGANLEGVQSGQRKDVHPGALTPSSSPARTDAGVSNSDSPAPRGAGGDSWCLPSGSEKVSGQRPSQTGGLTPNQTTEADASRLAQPGAPTGRHDRLAPATSLSTAGGPDAVDVAAPSQGAGNVTAQTGAGVSESYSHRPPALSLHDRHEQTETNPCELAPTTTANGAAPATGTEWFRASSATPARGTDGFQSKHQSPSEPAPSATPPSIPSRDSAASVSRGSVDRAQLAHDVTENHRRYMELLARLLAGLAVAATLTLSGAEPGRVAEEPAELSTSELGLFPGFPR